MDSMFVSKVTRAVQLSDSFFALGNVNPAAETNVGISFPMGYINTIIFTMFYNFFFKPTFIWVFWPMVYRTVQPFYF